MANEVKPAPAAPPKKNVAVKLSKAHRHDGVDYAEGDLVVVAPGIAAWMVKNNIGTVAAE